MPGRLLVDLLGVTGARGGTETYAREISVRLPRFLPDVTLTAVTGRVGAAPVSSYFPGRVDVLRSVGADPLTWAFGAAVLEDGFAQRHGADALWCPANFGPVRRGVPRVVTAHDATQAEHVGPGAPGLRGAVQGWLWRRSVATASEVVTGSEAAAEDIARVARIPRDRIHVIPHGTNDPASDAASRQDLVELGVPAGRPVVLSTGNRAPHKNFAGLVRAVAAIPLRARPLLVITGGPADDPLSSLATSLGVSDDVLLPGWVTLAQLEGLYAAADLYVCPSLTEGFGLPVIDALRRGVPVLANDVPVLREVGADVVTYADATDPAGLAAAILEVLDRGTDPDRRSAGRARSRSFTWDASAERTAQVLDLVLRGGTAR